MTPAAMIVGIRLYVLLHQADSDALKVFLLFFFFFFTLSCSTNG